MSEIAFAVGCHPDDIEFMMAGTLVRLKNAGYEIHYMNVANGSCGTDCVDAEEIVKIRRLESIEAAEMIGATYHESIAYDLEVFYDKPLLARLGAVMREVAPDIILTHSPNEYMEDHSNTCRLAVTAAFTRGMRNFSTNPPLPAISNQVVLYHSLPYGLTTPLRKPVSADLYVDVSDLISLKKEMLSKHKSQKEWLDVSQGMDSYLTTMADQCADIGKLSKKYDYAEGWIRHQHHGYCDAAADPLSELFQ